MMKNVLFVFAMAGVVGMVTGCASTGGGKEGKDQVAEWRSGRAPTNTVVSAVKNPVVKTGIDTLAIPVANIYRGVVDLVDKDAAMVDGRKLYIGNSIAVANSVKDGKSSADAWADVFAKASDDDAKAVKDYMSYANTSDFSIIGDKLKDMSAEVATLVKNVATNTPVLLSQIGASDFMDLKSAKKELGMLGEQAAGAKDGIILRMAINEADKAAKQYMKDYPVDK